MKHSVSYPFSAYMQRPGNIALWVVVIIVTGLILASSESWGRIIGGVVVIFALALVPLCTVKVKVVISESHLSVGSVRNLEDDTYNLSGLLPAAPKYPSFSITKDNIKSVRKVASSASQSKWAVWYARDPKNIVEIVFRSPIEFETRPNEPNTQKVFPPLKSVYISVCDPNGFVKELHGTK